MKRLIKGIDITDQKFGKLTPIKVVGKSVRGELMWECKCDCGNITIARSSAIRYGEKRSCGCLRLQRKPPFYSIDRYLKYDLTHKYGIGYTNTGVKFYFDLEDYEKIKPYSWNENKGYIYTDIKGKKVALHRFILNATKIVDHINHNKYDNRKCNLRECTTSQNSTNRKPYKFNKSGYNGVVFYDKLNKWQARIGVNKKIINLGYFTSKQDAINARKKAEEKYFGEFAYKENKNIIN